MPSRKKIGIGIDYSNICEDYNTTYLDRDNTDRETMGCMNKVLQWFDPFLSELLNTFSYNIYRINHNAPLDLKDIVRKRFFFYSLEKEIIAQTFIFQTGPASYESLNQWVENNDNSLLIQNDEEGEGVYFYFNENSKVHEWLIDTLKDFAWDEVPFEEA